jgi:hypothetical protein
LIRFHLDSSIGTKSVPIVSLLSQLQRPVP